MSSYSPPLQVLPTWLSYASATVPLETGGYSISLTVVQLPLTYYGPSIPLPSDGSWVWGGSSSPAPSTSTPIPTCTLDSCSTPSPTSVSSIFPPTVASSFTSAFPSTYSSLSTSSLTAITSSPSTSSPSTSPQSTSSSYAAPLSTSPISSHSRGLSGTEIALVAGLVGGFMVLLISALCCFAFWRRGRSRRVATPPAGFEEVGQDGDSVWEFVTSSHPRPVEPSPFVLLTNSASRPDPRDSLVASVEGATIGYVTGRARREMPTVTAASRDSGSTDYGEELPFSIAARSTGGPVYQGLALDDAEDIPENPASSSGSPTSPVFGNRVVEQENLFDNGRNGDSRRSGLYNTRSFRALVGALESYFEGRNSGWLSNLGQRLSSSVRPASEKSSNGSQGSRKSAKSHIIPLSSHPSQLGEKSQYLAVPPELAQTRESGNDSSATPTSEAFPAPPDTFGRMHALFRRRRSGTVSHSDSFQSGRGGHSTLMVDRPVSGYSGGTQSVASGQTVFHDALEEPVPEVSDARSSPRIFFAQTEQGDLAHLVPQLKSIRPFTSLFSMPPGSRSGPVATCTPSPSPRLLVGQPTPLDCDVLDEPAPLPSVVLQPPREGSIASMSSGPTSFTELTYQLPPGLEDYGRQSFFNLSPDSGYAFSGDSVNLESEPPSAGGDWQRIASTGSLLGPNRGVTVEHNGTRGHFRRDTLGQIVFHATETDRGSESASVRNTESQPPGRGHSRSRSHSSEEDHSPNPTPYSVQSSLSSRAPGVSVPCPSLSAFGSRPTSLRDAEPNSYRR